MQSAGNSDLAQMVSGAGVVNPLSGVRWQGWRTVAVDDLGGSLRGGRHPCTLPRIDDLGGNRLYRRRSRDVRALSEHRTPGYEMNGTPNPRLQRSEERRVGKK